ncbi:unannotated protein [freshwater metagenome]|uniref:Unannotated protein n=1 Tax=freshwater metagenome TaxID=449393 RepID=A0A6J6MCJ7_9ZZZZ
MANEDGSNSGFATNVRVFEPHRASLPPLAATSAIFGVGELLLLNSLDLQTKPNTWDRESEKFG